MAFSCKGRDICPSSATRRMVETGAHLVDNVLPRHGHLASAAVHTLDAPDHAGGWSVDASVMIPAWDRHGLERLVRYCARPALSQERLGRVSDEMLVYSLKKPTVDGRTEIYLTPLELNRFTIPPKACAGPPVAVDHSAAHSR